MNLYDVLLNDIKGIIKIIPFISSHYSMILNILSSNFHMELSDTYKQV